MMAKVEITHPQEKRKAIPPGDELPGFLALFFIETVKDGNRGALVAKLCSLFEDKASELREVLVSDGNCTRIFLNYHPYVVEKFQEHQRVRPYVVDVWDAEEIMNRLRDVLEIGWTVSLRFASGKRNKSVG